MSHGAPRRSRHSPAPVDRQLAGVVATTMHALATPSRVLILDRLRLARVRSGNSWQRSGVSNLPQSAKKSDQSCRRGEVAGRGGRVTPAGGCSRNHASLAVGRSAADETGQFQCASTLTAPAFPPATEPLAHALVFACRRTPPVLGFMQLYGTGTRLDVIDGNLKTL